MKAQLKIEENFRKIARKDKNVKNAYLLVNSEKLGIDINIAEGATGNFPANNQQPNYLASVGKLFTATIIGMLHERRVLDYEAKINNYLDSEIMSGLHIFKGVDYSGEITVKNLLKQTSGLNDVFYHLLNKLKNDPEFKITPKEAVIWSKNNLQPIGKPGEKHFYTDTNYYLLGLIIESLTKVPYHEVLHEMIFEPLGMNRAYMFGYSKPKVESQFPTAGVHVENLNCIEDVRFAQIDYAGGGVVAPLEEYLVFMKALVTHKLVKESTLNKMIYDDVKMGLPAIAFDYGYSIWKPKAIPVLLPKKYFCWGGVGVTGAFMFYHPLTESYIIGTFNDISYTSKALQFMLRKVIRELIKYSNN
ncbi:MAG: serine hydrolase domain-containing protein [Bacteroidota bacterium]